MRIHCNSDSTTTTLMGFLLGIGWCGSTLMEKPTFRPKQDSQRYIESVLTVIMTTSLLSMRRMVKNGFSISQKEVNYFTVNGE